MKAKPSTKAGATTRRGSQFSKEFFMTHGASTCQRPFKQKRREHQAPPHQKGGSRLGEPTRRPGGSHAAAPRQTHLPPVLDLRPHGGGTAEAPGTEGGGIGGTGGRVPVEAAQVHAEFRTGPELVVGREGHGQSALVQVLGGLTIDGARGDA